MIPFLDLRKTNLQYSKEIKEAIDRVVESGIYIQGDENRLFEEEYSNFIGTRFAIGCGNGLNALSLIFKTYKELGILREGDHVIVPANTYIATILSISGNGLIPILVEPDKDTYQIDSQKIEEAISPQTKAILIVHLYGQCAYTDKIGDICKKYNFILIEDNAQAHGCIIKGRRTGSLGHAAAHSFYPTKNLGAIGDGGAVTTDDPLIATTIRSIANYGSVSKNMFRYKGTNSRLDEIQAAVLRVKLKHLEEDNERRKHIAKEYIKGIDNINIKLPVISDFDAHVFHQFPILCEKRELLMRHLENKGIYTAIHYPLPPHLQECYREWNHRHYPVTEYIHANELSLPISPVLTQSEVTEIITAINNWEE